MTDATQLTEQLLAEILRDTHAYTPGIEPQRAAVVSPRRPRWRERVGWAREQGRDWLERAAARGGFSHRHFDPSASAARLARVIELAGGIEHTYTRLADEASREALLKILKLRVLGPYHVQLAITAEEFRVAQLRVDQELMLQRGTYQVSDPWFSPLSLYRVPVDGGEPVSLHAHSVDVVSVFALGQYSYSNGRSSVAVEPGDVVLDVGGCWGDTALYFASLAGPRGKVYTFEFDPESLAIMRANLALNPRLAERIEIVERALWDRSGEELRITQAGRCTTVRNGDSGESGLRVSTITLDDFVAQAGLERLDFVKMDVEGAEPHVLQGAGVTLGRLMPKLAIAAYHRDDDLVRIPQELGDEYRLYLGSFSPVEEETVLFADATRRNNST